MLSPLLRSLRPLPLSLSLAAFAAASSAGAQERLHLEEFGDMPLYRLGSRDRDRHEGAAH